MMQPRLSRVEHVEIDAVVFASAFHVGDNARIRPRTYVLAVRRDITSFRDEEGNFTDYPIYRRRMPRPLARPFVRKRTIHEDPEIQVRTAHVLSVSTSGVFQIGSTRMIHSDARVKHFRQLLALTPLAPLPQPASK